MSKLEKFLKESNLSAEAKKVIQEAWDAERDELGAEIRLEMKQRYSEDLEKLTEGLSTLVSETINTEMKGLYEEKAKLVQDRKTLRESLGKFYTFSQQILSEQVKDMRSEAKHLNESLGKFMKFSNVVLSEEIKEFHDEKRELVESRIKLLTEGRAQIAKFKQNFAERTALASARYIAESTEKHLKELQNDLMEAKQNKFGRKIFEAFGEEFLRNQFKENSILKELKESINSKENELLKVRKELSESKAIAQDTAQKIKIMEDVYLRKNILSELLKPLTASQKQVMESLLSSSPTEKLNEDFNKYHKSVLRGVQTQTPKSRTNLNEGSVVTGNRNKQINESVELDDEDLAFLDKLQKNAGI